MTSLTPETTRKILGIPKAKLIALAARCGLHPNNYDQWAITMPQLAELKKQLAYSRRNAEDNGEQLTMFGNETGTQSMFDRAGCFDNLTEV